MNVDETLKTLTKNENEKALTAMIALMMVITENKDFSGESFIIIMDGLCRIVEVFEAQERLEKMLTEQIETFKTYKQPFDDLTKGKKWAFEHCLEVLKSEE